jgi:hypothetical protein
MAKGTVSAGGFIQGIKEHPVETAATVGSLVAGPLAGGAASALGRIALAGLGGAGGAAAGIAGRQLAGGRAESPDAALQTIARQGAGQAAGQGFGEGSIALANKVVPHVLKQILAPRPGLQREFPDVVQTMRQERIPIGQSKVAGQRAGESAAKAQAMIAEAKAAGVSPIRVKELHPSMADAQAYAQKDVGLGKPDRSGAITERMTEMYKRWPQGIPIDQAQPLKTHAQMQARDAYRTKDAGNPIDSLATLIEEGQARGLRQGIERRAPAIGQVNARTQSLMGLEEALQNAELRNGGVGSLNPLHIAARVFPGTSSRGAFLADTGASAMQSPPIRLIRQALLALLAGDSEQ